MDGMDTAVVKSQLELEMRLHSVEESLDKSERLLAERNEETRRLNEQITQLTSK